MLSTIRHRVIRRAHNIPCRLSISWVRRRFKNIFFARAVAEPRVRCLAGVLVRAAAVHALRAGGAPVAAGDVVVVVVALVGGAGGLVPERAQDGGGAGDDYYVAFDEDLSKAR